MKSVHFLLSQQFVRLRNDERGISAVEFAMLLPLMVTLYLGTVEVSQAVGIDRKVTLTTRALADLAAQVKTINNVEMSNLLDASTAVIAPYDTNKLKMTVSRVDVDGNGTARIVWTDTRGGSAAHAPNDVVSLPTALNVKNSSLIWSEVNYTYKPTIGYVVTGPMNLTDQIYMRPRLSDTVARTAT
jgi:Flp pilus assembly protein TadG